MKLARKSHGGSLRSTRGAVLAGALLLALGALPVAYATHTLPVSLWEKNAVEVLETEGHDPPAALSTRTRLASGTSAGGLPYSLDAWISAAGPCLELAAGADAFTACGLPPGDQLEVVVDPNPKSEDIFVYGPVPDEVKAVRVTLSTRQIPSPSAQQTESAVPPKEFTVDAQILPQTVDGIRFYLGNVNNPAAAPVEVGTDDGPSTEDPEVVIVKALNGAGAVVDQKEAWLNCPSPNLPCLN